MPDEPVDAAAVVAEIEAEVARKRAAGEYPESLLRALHAEFEPGGLDPPELLAQVDIIRRPRSARPVVGPAIVFGKRALRRAISWYVQPIAASQTRFNIAVLRDLRRVQRQTLRVGANWSNLDAVARAFMTDDATQARASAFCSALDDVGSPVLLAGVPARVLDTLESRMHAYDIHRTQDAMAALDAAGPSSLAAVALCGVVSRLDNAELLTVFHLAHDALRRGGRLVVDCNSHSSTDDPDSVDPTLHPAIAEEVWRRLLRTFGFSSVERTFAADGWFMLRASAAP